MAAGSIQVAPAPAEVDGYVYTTPATFAATFAAAGGTQIEIETIGRSGDLKGQTWNALGIDRISATGMDPRLGQADGIYKAASGQGVSFAPEWMQNGAWTTLAQHPGNYTGTVTTQLASPVLTIATVTWRGAGSPTFTENLTITPDGVLSQTTETGNGPFGMTLPLLHSDGRTTLVQTIGNGVASVSYPGGSSAENFLALNGDAVLTRGNDVLSAYGELTPVSAVSSAGEQDTFVYQSSGGDPSAASVRSSFSLGASGYTSSLGWVNGTLYSGRTSAGGFGSSIALSGSGTPDVVFSNAVDFILQVNHGVITNVETDAAVTATILGKTYTLGANAPQAVSGGSSATPTITLADLGTVQEVSVGAGVTVNELIRTRNLSGTVYEEVLTAGGAVESGFQAVTLDANGSATSVVHLANSGDVVRVQDKLTAPSVVAVSSPVTIIEPSGGGSTTPVTIGSGPDTLAMQISEDAWQGDAQFTVAVDGRQIDGVQTAKAPHSAGQSQTFNVLGSFAPGNHTVSVNFLNNLYGGSATADRNLYVTSATFDNTVVSGATLTEYVNGPQSFSFVAPGTTGNSVTVDHPANLRAAVQTLTGTESGASQPIFLDWHTSGVPALNAGDWVQATVASNGQFSAVVTIDHPGTSSTMFYRIGNGPAVAAWPDTPA